MGERVANIDMGICNNCCVEKEKKMANPTTNYGFIMPSSTDLVTDLPADFDVFGQAVDTQMLTNANAAIAKAIVDAKGDIISATAADTPARLAVGANGTVLTADSAETTGLKWAAAATGGMNLISTVSTGGGVTAINFGSDASPIFSSTYDNYRITFVGTASGGINPQIRMRADTTNATGANYNDQYLNVTGTTVAGARTTGATFAQLPPLDTARGAFTIDLYSPFIAATTTYYAVGPSPISTISFQQWIGQHTLATSYNGFGILTGSATTIDGTFYIYGLAK